MFEGSYVALVTPFYPDGSINFDRLKQLCQWHVENGRGYILDFDTEEWEKGRRCLILREE